MKAKFKIIATLDDRERVFEGTGDLKDKKLPLAEVAMAVLKGVQDEEELHAATGLEITLEIVR